MFLKFKYYSLKNYLIFLESTIYKINFISIKNNYFTYDHDSIIFYPLYYKFKINMWSFILYGKYIEYKDLLYDKSLLKYFSPITSLLLFIYNLISHHFLAIHIIIK